MTSLIQRATIEDFDANQWPKSALVIVMQPSAARPESLNELYEQAKPEWALVLYTGAGPAAAKAAAEAFEKRFPGIARHAAFEPPLRERLS